MMALELTINNSLCILLIGILSKTIYSKGLTSIELGNEKMFISSEKSMTALEKIKMNDGLRRNTIEMKYTNGVRRE